MFHIEELTLNKQSINKICLRRNDTTCGRKETLARQNREQNFRTTNPQYLVVMTGQQCNFFNQLSATEEVVKIAAPYHQNIHVHPPLTLAKCIII